MTPRSRYTRNASECSKMNHLIKYLMKRGPPTYNDKLNVAKKLIKERIENGQEH